MATKRLSPNRASNRRVSFDLTLFCQQFVRAVGREQTPLGQQFAEGKPFSGHVSERLCDYPGGSSRSAFGVDYLLSEMLSKYDDGKPSPTKEASTWERFGVAEERCRLTNAHINKDTGQFSFGPTVAQIMLTAQRKISSLLGEFRWEEASDGFDWGPGATFSLPRRRSDPVHKYQGIPETTLENLGLASCVIDACPAWLAGLSSEEGCLKLVRGNKIITVPKNFKTDRVIAVEPRMNMYIQKGIGSMIRKRLKRVGIDLNSQDRNRSLALNGSLTNYLATIDLSLASDTISLELVRSLLPVDWVTALEQCRSPEGVLPSGEWITYQKFSSMGNGYTFELESLLFWALCSSVMFHLGLKDAVLAVYGDDIIVPSESAPQVLEVLEYAGFASNEKKTFFSGLFRESCGFHAFDGYDVTPFYVRKEVKQVQDLFLLHNNVYRWCVRNQWNTDWNRSLMRELIESLRSAAPPRWRRPRLPDGFGDGAFIGTFDEATPIRASHGLEGYIVPILVDHTEYREVDTYGRLLKGLRAVERRRSALDYLSGPSVVQGGIARSQRSRVVKALVPQFSLVNPFQG